MMLVGKNGARVAPTHACLVPGCQEKSGTVGGACRYHMGKKIEWLISRVTREVTLSLRQVQPDAKRPPEYVRDAECSECGSQNLAFEQQDAVSWKTRCYRGHVGLFPAPPVPAVLPVLVKEVLRPQQLSVVKPPKKVGPGRRWTAEDDEVLRELVLTHRKTIDELMPIFDRNWTGIQSRITKIVPEVVDDPLYPPWSPSYGRTDK